MSQQDPEPGYQRIDVEFNKYKHVQTPAEPDNLPHDSLRQQQLEAPIVVPDAQNESNRLNPNIPK